MYRGLIAQWSDPREAISGTQELGVIWNEDGIVSDLPDHVARLRHFDMMHYLPDDILTKVYHANVAAALDASEPLLKHRVVGYAWRLPRSQIGRGADSKRMLSRIHCRHVPRELIERPKMGFGVSIGE